MTPEVATLSFRDLEYLIAIAEHQNFRLAAKACAVSQPALSGQVKKVEQSLGIQIFERTNREVLVTSIGEDIIEQSRTILEELETLGTISRGADSPLSGPFRLGVISTLSPYLMPRISSDIHRAYPKLDLIIRESIDVELLELLRIGKMDAVIGTLPIPEKSGRFSFSKIFEEPLLSVVSDKSKRANQKLIDLRDVSIDELVSIDEQDSLTKFIFQHVTDQSSKIPSQRLFTTSIESLYYMISNSERVGVVPYLATKNKRAFKNIEHKRLAPESLRRDIGLIWRKRYRGAVALASFAERLQRVVVKHLK